MCLKCKEGFFLLLETEEVALSFLKDGPKIPMKANRETGDLRGIGMLLLLCVGNCTGFDWDRILRRNLYGDIFWIPDQNGGDKNSSVWLLQSSAYTALRFFHAALPGSGLGCMRGWERIQPGALLPDDQRDSPYHGTSCSAIKTKERRRKQAVQS